MSFSNHLRKLAQPVWDAQLTHPFVLALGKGTLSERKFRYYILQDARFLADLARVFAAGSVRAPDAESALRFAKLAEDTIIVERSLHENYGKRWNLSPQHMLTVAQSGTATEIGVVALPCAWIYCVVGKHLLKNGAPPAKHPYRDWLMLYASPEFEAVQEWMRARIDTWARTAGHEEKKRMEHSFLISSKYEWMFWEMAWNEEKWPV